MIKPKTLQVGGIFLAASLFLVITFSFLSDISSAHAANQVKNPKLLQPIDLQQIEPCDCSADTLSCFSFASRQDAQACYDHCQATVGSDVHGLDTDGDKRACESRPNATATPAPTTEIGGEATPLPEATITVTEAMTPTATPTPILLYVNLVNNGNFEEGFYGVPELGFEARDIGFVPNGWGWYRNQAYGKYTIRTNQAFGLQCPFDGQTAPVEDDDPTLGPIPEVEPIAGHNTLALHIQSTDEIDARLGVYQTVNVVPGQDYRFSMSATIQVQAEARTLDEYGPDGELIPHAPNHTFELYFDHTGNTDWRAIPFEKWTNIPIPEEKLFFSVEETERDGLDALAVIYNYETMVKARSDKMTIFITGWRKWANFRSTVFNIDCVWLTPLDAQGQPIRIPQAAASSDDAQPAAITQPSTDDAGQEPPQTEATETPTEEPPQTIIPPSGGILERNGNTLLIIIASAIIIIGLIAAGVWNMRR
jgi:hypothetical protein